MKLTTLAIVSVLFAGCATERQMSFGEVPIIRIEQTALSRKAHQRGAIGLVEYSPAKIYYSAELTEMQAIANVIHEGIGHLHVFWTGDARIWDTIDRLAAKDAHGMGRFPVASDRHPSRQIFAWETGERAQEIRAIYAATVAARQAGGKY